MVVKNALSMFEMNDGSLVRFMKIRSDRTLEYSSSRELLV
jgi:hypothetical protein